MTETWRHKKTKQLFEVEIDDRMCKLTSDKGNIRHIYLHELKQNFERVKNGKS